jgi:hypothetical protein
VFRLDDEVWAKVEYSRRLLDGDVDLDDDEDDDDDDRRDDDGSLFFLPSGPFNPCLFKLLLLLGGFVEARVEVMPFMAVDFLDFCDTMAFKNLLRCFSTVFGPESLQLLKLVTSFLHVRISRVLARVIAT